MNNVNKICMTVLLAGAAAIATPAFAQSAATPSNSPQAPADAAPMDKAATTAGTTNTAAASSRLPPPRRSRPAIRP